METGMTIFRHGAAVRRRAPAWQTVVMLVLGVGISDYALRASQGTFRAASIARFTTVVPVIVDGDTIRINGKPIRVIGIDAPDSEPLRRLSADHLRRLAARDGGMTCSVNLFARLTTGSPCRTPPTSYGRANLSCVFNKNGADVAATMVAHGQAVDYRVFSDGVYRRAMLAAASARQGLWGAYYPAMATLANRRATVGDRKWQR